MPKKGEQWTITIEKFGGFAPAWWENTYPAYGNKNHAGDMQNVSLIDPSVLTQGPGLSDLTNGDENGAVSTLIKGILKHATSSDKSYAVGGNQLYEFSASSVTNAGSFPHTIDKAAVTGEDGEDVCEYQSKLYYSYNHSGSAGDIGQFDLSSTFDDDYFSAAATGGADLQDGPHQMVVGGDDVLYTANGRFIATLDGSTATPQGLDFHTDAIVTTIGWNHNRVIAGVTRPNITGTNQNLSAVYRWDGISDSWEGDPIEVGGRIGALYVKNGVTYVFSDDISSSGGHTLAAISGLQLRDLARFKGDVPDYYQVTEYKGFLIWVGDDRIYAWGTPDTKMPLDLFQLADGGHSTVGGLGKPFDEPVVASHDGSSAYRLAEFSGHETTASYKTIMFNVSGASYVAQIDRIVVETEDMSSGAAMDATLRYDSGKSSQSLNQVAYDATNTPTRHDLLDRDSKQIVENFRIEFDWSNGSATNPVKVKGLYIEGHYIKRP